MSINRELTDDELLDVTGGFMDFNMTTNVLTFDNPDDKTDHRVYTLNAATAYKAFEYSNLKHSEGIPESQIITEMLALGYIK